MRKQRRFNESAEVRMPSLKKKALSLYLRSLCQRQLALNLYGDKEKRDLGMPPRQTARAGLGLVGQAGYEWQDEKVSELEAVFGEGSVHVNSKREGRRPGALELAEVLPHTGPYQFVVEGRYDADTNSFREGVGIDVLRDRWDQPLGVGNAYPDIVQVLPAMASRPLWEAGPEEDGPDALALEVLPSGDVRHLVPNDDRLRLRVIDIKQSAEPGAHYFAEVVYYSITLAAWLIELGWSDQFVVVAAPAVWPGSYEASAIVVAKEQARKLAREATPEELALALQDDIEIAPFDVFAPRLRRFFQEELPHVLQMPWDELPWHVSYLCKGCEFLGYPWLDKQGQRTDHPLHCWPTAKEQDHLSRVAGLSKGGARLLGDVAADVSALAEVLSDNPAFDRSPSLRSKRTVYPHRALALRDDIAGVVPDSGGDALMPRWPDLHIYVFLDYDLSSAVTATFSLRAFWKEPLPFTSVEKPKSLRWVSFGDGESASFQEVFLVDQRDLERERQELIKFLRALKTILDKVHGLDEADIAVGRRGNTNPKRSSYQIYLWDEAQRKHLVRVIGRHLGAILANSHLRDLAWLFPPPELLAYAEEASYRSPFTLVSSVVQNTVAVPVPHHYTLLETVLTFRPDSFAAPTVHPLYCEPLSDLIPGERLHEMWTHRGDWLQTMNTIEETTRKKLLALAYVVSQLERSLKQVLNRAAAPPVIRAPRRMTGVPPHSQLWHEFTRLNAALEELESHATRAMPAHEREARFKSARLLRRLEGEEKAAAHERLQAVTPQTLPQAFALVVYELAPTSYEVNIRPPDLGYALAPRGDPGFLNNSAYPLVKNVPDEYFPEGRTPNAKGSVAEAGLTQVSVVALDRVEGLIALKPWRSYCVEALERAKVLDLSFDAMLDPVTSDYLSKKVRLTLEGIGRPLSATTDERIVRALGAEVLTMTPTPETPAAEFLWQAPALAATPISRETSAARQALEAAGVLLNSSQWTAWDSALTRRLTLIWGPPGTGKSQTIRAVIAGAIWVAQQTERSLRVLISAGTYAASDNVLIGTDTLLRQLLPSKPYRLVRLQSQYSTPPSDIDDEEHVGIEQIVIKMSPADHDITDLQDHLNRLNEQGAEPSIIVVAGPPQQLHNLAISTRKKTKKAEAAQTQRPWFDLVIIDEASQLDVASATLVVSKAAYGAAFVLAGDDKQLPPIHQATPPQDLDHVVGSVYGYVRHHHGVTPESLQVNYRSNTTLVELTKRAGYDPRLHARYPDLRLAILGDGLPTEQTDDWPDNLVWTPNWSRLLDPLRPATCFIYEDEVASQANDFEADAVSALLSLLYGRVDRQLAGELNNDGYKRQLTGLPHTEQSFWEQGVGIVTPHRAQMAKIIGRLQRVFPDHNPALIWGAVDTVERFQGQQRDVIVASFGLGDPDLIRAEDEFIYKLNRFNVMISRARAKLIVLVTRTLVEHLSDNPEVLDQSRFLKYFAEIFCKDPEPVTLSYLTGNARVERPGVLRTRRWQE
jgi:DNA replication ATP-dependent helicase Dna2